jgi:hypothetical protein
MDSLVFTQNPPPIVIVIIPPVGQVQAMIDTGACISTIVIILHNNCTGPFTNGRENL